MPPRNPARALFTEDGLAHRIAYERDQRGWTYEGLAKRMTDAGCAINQSAIYKIEKGKPRRRITVDELVALAKVFDLDVNDLLIPLETLLDKRGRDLVAACLSGLETLEAYEQGLNEDWQRLRAHLEQRPEFRDYVQSRFELIVNPALRESATEVLSWRAGTRFAIELQSVWVIEEEPGFPAEEVDHGQRG